MATETGFPHSNILDKICKDLSIGADIGCVGNARSPSYSTNAPSAFEYGPHVTDAIADWIKKGFAFGPVPLKEIPKDAKVMLTYGGGSIKKTGVYDSVKAAL